MSNNLMVMKAVEEMENILRKNEDSLIIKKIKGMKKVPVEDVYAAQVYVESLAMGKIQDVPSGKAHELLKKFNVI